MNEPTRTTPTDPDPADADPALPAPDPVGEIVPGNPPVPITVWHLPPPRPGDAVPVTVTRRLAANYSHAGANALALVTTSPPTTSPPTTSPPTRHDGDGGHRVELVVTTWPMAGVAPESHIGACADRVAPEGCLAVVLANSDIPDQLGTLVGVARATGLTYLQHIVIAHTLRPRPAPPGNTHGVTGHTGTGRARSARDQSSGPRHLRVHTDVLVFRKRGQDADD